MTAFFLFIQIKNVMYMHVVKSLNNKKKKKKQGVATLGKGVFNVALVMDRCIGQIKQCSPKLRVAVG